MAFSARLGQRTYAVEIEEIGKSLYRVAVEGNEFLVDGKKTGLANYSLIVENRSFEVDVDTSGDEYRVLVDGRSYHIQRVDELDMVPPPIDERRMRLGGFQAGIQLQGRQEVSVPMPGKPPKRMR